MGNNTAIQLRNDTNANWTSDNPTLAHGEMGLETDTNRIKFGDGSTAWTELPYFIGNPYRKLLKVYPLAAQSVSSNTPTLLAYNTVVTDVYSVYDNTVGNYKWTAPSAGVYYVQALNGYSTGNIAGSVYMYIYVNGSAVTSNILNVPSIVGNRLPISMFLTLDAGDYVQIYTQLYSSSNQTTYSGSFYYFQIYGV